MLCLSSTSLAPAQSKGPAEVDLSAVSLSLPIFPTGLDEHPSLRIELEMHLSAAQIEISENLSKNYNYPRFFIGRSFVELNFLFSEPATFDPTSNDFLSLKSEAETLGLTALITPLDQHSKFNSGSENFLTIRANLVGNPFSPEPGFAKDQLANLVQFVQTHRHLFS